MLLPTEKIELYVKEPHFVKRSGVQIFCRALQSGKKGVILDDRVMRVPLIMLSYTTA